MRLPWHPRKLLSVVSCALLSACTLINDRDALSRDWEKGAGGVSGSAGDGTGGGLSGNIGGCVPGPEDSLCDGLDQSCQPVASDPGCPLGCTGSVREARTYMACASASPFGEAETRCAARGMHLVHVHGGVENESLAELARTIGSFVWLGGSSERDAATFEWTDDGSPFYENGAPLPGVYQNFGPNEPVADPERRCVQLHDATALWSSTRCSDVLQFLCAR